jgi:hypothetical protein
MYLTLHQLLLQERTLTSTATADQEAADILMSISQSSAGTPAVPLAAVPQQVAPVSQLVAEHEPER